MSSSPKAFTIKAVRWSKDVEVPNDIENPQTAAPQRIKFGAKAKELAARFVPAVLGELNHPESYYVHPVIPPPSPSPPKMIQDTQGIADCHAVHAEVGLQCRVGLLYRL